MYAFKTPTQRLLYSSNKLLYRHKRCAQDYRDYRIFLLLNKLSSLTLFDSWWLRECLTRQKRKWRWNNKEKKIGPCDHDEKRITEIISDKMAFTLFYSMIKCHALRIKKKNEEDSSTRKKIWKSFKMH